MHAERAGQEPTSGSSRRFNGRVDGFEPLNHPRFEGIALDRFSMAQDENIVTGPLTCRGVDLASHLLKA